MPEKQPTNDPTIQELHGLVADLRTKFEDVAKGRLTKADIEAGEQKLNERIDALETIMSRPPATPEQERTEQGKKFDVAYSAWLRKGQQGMSAEEKSTLFGIASLSGKDTLLLPDEKKVLTISDDTLGGYLAAQDKVLDIIKGVTDISPMRSIARVRSTTARSIEQPTRTGQPTGVWVAEIGTRSETTGLTFGMEEIPCHECYADIRVSKQNLEDSAFNLEQIIREEAVLALAKLEGTAFITGDANGKPEGITLNAANIAASVITGSNTAITASPLITFTYTPKADYARNGKYIMRRDTVRQIRQLVDGASRYLWEPSFAPGQPQTLLGYPIVEFPDMPAVAQNAYAIAFGDFYQHYTIADRVQIEIQRLDELYAASGQVGFLVRKRVGGQVVLAEAVKLHKVSA